MSSTNDDALAYMATVAFGLAIFAMAAMLIILIWAIISAAEASYRYRKYLSEAKESFDRIRALLGLDINVDAVLEGVFGVEVSGGNDAWLGGAVFGTAA